jgi:hypothetical protein
MGWPAVFQPHQREKLARGAKLKEHAMSQKLNSGVAVGPQLAGMVEHQRPILRFHVFVKP